MSTPELAAVIYLCGAALTFLLVVYPFRHAMAASRQSFLNLTDGQYRMLVALVAALMTFAWPIAVPGFWVLREAIRGNLE